MPFAVRRIGVMKPSGACVMYGPMDGLVVGRTVFVEHLSL
eukprot:CAMPEP_0119568136 /NCGR_PEP_ID=MMETSP1352-20130426/38002_1 /TAXON_ID=265584 /ORGANISM="Stauroneis constricta, Strain CCMP1120" /LENGTH=39 /DNA_ID= /DNA_START= /DNA_END= /DNA_ORIENTATION=